MDDKTALLNFIGQIYGQSAALDKNIVQSTKDTKPVSGDMSNMFKQVAAAPATTIRATLESTDIPAPLVEPESVPPESLPQTINNIIQNTNDENHYPRSATPQNMNADSIVQELKNITYILTRIADSLKENTNVSTKKQPKNTK